MKMIGRYRVRGQIGRGGMGRVYKVEMPVTGKIAALKLLKPNELLVRLMGSAAIEDLFLSEAVTLANLRHPNVMEIWDVDTADGHPFYIMDYCCNNLGVLMGETYITESPSRILPIDRVLHYIRQILCGIACLHHAGIIHRDIKPFNILVTDYDGVKICDFGLSKLRGERFKGPPNLKVGSPWYTAPEQEKNPDEADDSADLYSVGVMLYRMLTGLLPMDAPHPPSRLHRDLDTNWDDFIMKAIAPAPSGRYRDAAVMLREFDSLKEWWIEKKETICRYPVTPAIKIHVHRKRRKIPRSEPLKAGLPDARKRFGLDELWRPEQYIPNDFISTGDGLVKDEATRLMWEQSGSPYPMTWSRAHAYIESLNRNRFAGHDDWRLPTVDELISLLDQTSYGETSCGESVFDGAQKWLWSSDRRSYIAAWYVSMDLGFVSCQDFSGYYYVRGVRSSNEKAPVPGRPPRSSDHGAS